MASRFQPSDKSENSRFSLGRGRGVMGVHSQSGGFVGRDVGSSPVLPARDRGLESDKDLTASPMGQVSWGGPHHSTPSGDCNTLHQLSDMICQLGSQIGESIAARLMSGGALGNVNQSSAPSHNQPAQPCGNVSTFSENTHLNVIVKSDREPVIFRGDTTDKFTVTEWVELMKSYIRKQNIDVISQTEEVMGRLMGKARDVVKIGLRSNPTLATNCTPDVIYNMLIQYFSSTSSCLPLQDFYSTQPNQRENPIDYWIRLNKAADMAVEGLKRQGRHMEDIAGEIAKMFVKHCPDPELASVFKYKQIHEWTSKEIQERIDEYQRERVSSVKMPRTHAAALFCNDAQIEPHNTCSIEASSANSLPSPALPLGVVPSLLPSPALCQNQQQSFCQVPQSQQSCLPPLPQNQQKTLSSAPPYQLPQSQQQGGDAMLGEMMSMLRELLKKVQVGDGRFSLRRGGRQVRNQAHSVHETSCQVCNDGSHTTESHCRSARLCFSCLKPGHTRRSCLSKNEACDKVQGN